MERERLKKIPKLKAAGSKPPNSDCTAAFADRVAKLGYRDLTDKLLKLGDGKIAEKLARLGDEKLKEKLSKLQDSKVVNKLAKIDGAKLEEKLSQIKSKKTEEKTKVGKKVEEKKYPTSPTTADVQEDADKLLVRTGLTGKDRVSRLSNFSLEKITKFLEQQNKVLTHKTPSSTTLESDKTPSSRTWESDKNKKILSAELVDSSGDSSDEDDPNRTLDSLDVIRYANSHKNKSNEANIIHHRNNSHHSSIRHKSKSHEHDLKHKKHKQSSREEYSEKLSADKVRTEKPKPAPVKIKPNPPQTKKLKRKNFRPPAEPVLAFTDILKLAQQKATEPVKVAVVAKKPKKEERPLTQEEKDRLDRRLNKNKEKLAGPEGNSSKSKKGNNDMLEEKVINKKVFSESKKVSSDSFSRSDKPVARSDKSVPGRMSASENVNRNPKSSESSGHRASGSVATKTLPKAKISNSSHEKSNVRSHVSSNKSFGSSKSSDHSKTRVEVSEKSLHHKNSSVSSHHKHSSMTSHSKNSSMSSLHKNSSSSSQHKKERLSLPESCAMSSHKKVKLSLEEKSSTPLHHDKKKLVPDKSGRSLGSGENPDHQKISRPISNDNPRQSVKSSTSAQLEKSSAKISSSSAKHKHSSDNVKKSVSNSAVNQKQSVMPSKKKNGSKPPVVFLGENENLLVCGPGGKPSPSPDPEPTNPFDRIYSQIKKNHPQPKKRKHNVIETDSEEEYDEEMDDFIVDSEEDEYNGGANISNCIRNIFGYDRRKYRYESDAEIANMETKWREQLKEEARSARLGLLEDLEDIAKEEEEIKRKKMQKNKKRF